MIKLKWLSLLLLMTGFALQGYNYIQYKQYRWSIIKKPITFNKVQSRKIQTDVDLTGVYDLTLFYKKMVLDESGFKDPLSLKVSLNDEQKTFTQLAPSIISRKGVEVKLASFDLEKMQRVTLEITVLSPTKHDEDIELSLALNEERAKELFSQSSVFELFAYLSWLFSFMSFFTGIVLNKSE